MTGRHHRIATLAAFAIMAAAIPNPLIGLSLFNTRAAADLGQTSVRRSDMGCRGLGGARAWEPTHVIIHWHTALCYIATPLCSISP